MKHYIAMSSSGGLTLADYCNVYPNRLDAANDLADIFDLSLDEFGELNSTGKFVHHDELIAQLLEIVECDCNEPHIHQDDMSKEQFYDEYRDVYFPLTVDGKYKPVITVRNLEYYDEFVLVSDSQDTDAVKQHIGKSAQDYDSFFVYAANGDYVAVYGMSGIVPNLDKTLDLVWPVEPEPKTIVLFRMWDLYYSELGFDRPKADPNSRYSVVDDHFQVLIAVFPELPASVIDWRECESYQHIGQHSACLYEKHIEDHSIPAKPYQYEALKTELEKHYGYNLVVADECTQEMRDNRRKNWLQMMGRSNKPTGAK